MVAISMTGLLHKKHLWSSKNEMARDLGAGESFLHLVAVDVDSNKSDPVVVLSTGVGLNFTNTH